MFVRVAVLNVPAAILENLPDDHPLITGSQSDLIKYSNYMGRHSFAKKVEAMTPRRFAAFLVGIQEKFASNLDALRKEREDWLRVCEAIVPREEFSKQFAASLRMPTAAAMYEWFEGAPDAAIKPDNWKDCRRYLPNPLPDGWVIRQHRTDGALMLSTEPGIDGCDIVMGLSAKTLPEGNRVLVSLHNETRHNTKDEIEKRLGHLVRSRALEERSPPQGALETMRLFLRTITE